MGEILLMGLVFAVVHADYLRMERADLAMD
jgi:hypothetical protein